MVINSSRKGGYLFLCLKVMNVKEIVGAVPTSDNSQPFIVPRPFQVWQNIMNH